jgi:hypothetical protein
MTFLNLTPHVLNIHSGDNVTVIAPSGVVPRVSVDNVHVNTVDGIDIYSQTVGQVQDLPDFKTGVTLVVSALVRTALPARKDLASPGALLRDDSGRPIGCQGLVIN